LFNIATVDHRIGIVPTYNGDHTYINGGSANALDIVSLLRKRRKDAAADEPNIVATMRECQEKLKDNRTVHEASGNDYEGDERS